MRQLVATRWDWCPWICQVKKVWHELLAITTEITRWSMLKVSWSAVWLWLGGSGAILPLQVVSKWSNIILVHSE